MRTNVIVLRGTISSAPSQACSLLGRTGFAVVGGVVCFGVLFGDCFPGAVALRPAPLVCGGAAIRLVAIETVMIQVIRTRPHRRFARFCLAALLVTLACIRICGLVFIVPLSESLVI